MPLARLSVLTLFALALGVIPNALHQVIASKRVAGTTQSPTVPASALARLPDNDAADKESGTSDRIGLVITGRSTRGDCTNAFFQSVVAFSKGKVEADQGR